MSAGFGIAIIFSANLRQYIYTHVASKNHQPSGRGLIPALRKRQKPPTETNSATAFLLFSNHEKQVISASRHLVQIINAN
jgi:hypothetical protein